MRAIFPNPDGVLIPGMYVNANLAQAIVENATILPRTAVTLTPKGDAQVYVVNAENKIELREIKTSGTFNGQWVVTEGLNAGDRVVVMGGAKVKPDQAVEVKIAEPNAQNAQTAEQPQEPQQGQAQDGQSQNPAPSQEGQNSVMAPPQAPTAPAPQADVQSEAESMADSTEAN